VIENSRGPGGDRVARGALRRRRRESSSNVIWNITANGCSALECRRVASITIRRAERIIIAHVTRGTRGRGRRHVSASQSKSRGAVIKRRRQETHGCMAGAAVRNGK